ncbi:MAG: alkaline phosphatase family protein [Verrucomicrobia bacterium]|nr:alkaline phosphatase family protein [Verrucomicrobiota bacterium]
MPKADKVLVIGLDSTPHGLIFDEMTDRLPNFRRLMDAGRYGKLNSTIPAITIPAWSVMLTSKNPGRLGFYGFRNRKGYSYDEMWIANNNAVKEPRVWDVLGAAGKRSIAIGVPQTYPPKPLNGELVASFLTPDTTCEYTYPKELSAEIKDVVGGYMLDADDFRTEDKQRLLDDIRAMTEKRFKLVRHMMTTRPWDFFMFVEMGPDRIQHGFWKYHDPQHRLYRPGNPFENAIRDYYVALDREIGTVLDLLDERTAVLVVSDHGAQRMDGSICINDFLIQKNWLTLREPPPKVTRLKNLSVDWPKTKAWGWGGYVSRVFLNVKGREAQGAVEPSEYERTRDELIALFKSIPDDKGRPLRTQCFKPNEIYSLEHIEQAPDLIVYFDDLYWRATEDVGHDSIWSFETEIGPDDAMHAQHGMHILAWPGAKRGRNDKANLIDGAPTILDLLGVPVPKDMEGRSLAQ